MAFRVVTISYDPDDLDRSIIISAQRGAPGPRECVALARHLLSVAEQSDPLPSPVEGAGPLGAGPEATGQESAP